MFQIQGYFHSLLDLLPNHIKSLPLNKEIIFIPDRWLGDYILRKTGRRLILWNGFCQTHENILAEDIIKLKEKYPDADVIVHPECTRDVVELADGVFGTSGMIKYVKESKSSEFIIGTESGIIHRLKKENPEKTFYSLEPAICPNMKLTTLEKVLWALEDEEYKIELPKDVIIGARKPIERMLELV